VVYQSLLTGRQMKCTDGRWGEPCWIRQIRDQHGALLFENQIEERRVLDADLKIQMALMLREVIESGTGRRAFGSLSLQPSRLDYTSLAFPAVGKTGTTNDYRNVAFIGGVPTWDSIASDFRFAQAVSVGTYVGYDDNRAMKGRGLRIAGASGALPPWSRFVEGMLVSRQDSLHVDFLDPEAVARGEVPWHLPGRAGEWMVDAVSGLPPQENSSASVVVMPWLDFSLILNEDALPEAPIVDTFVGGPNDPLPEWGEPDAEIQD